MQNSDYFHHNVERLSHEVLGANLPTPDEILHQMVEELAAFPSVYAAGALQMTRDRSGLSYSHRSGTETGIIGLSDVLTEYTESLKNALHNQTSLTLRSLPAGPSEPSFFTALPVGNVAEHRICLALLSERALTDSEQSQVLLLGRLVGQSAHSAHIHLAMIEDEWQRAINLIALIAHELRTPLTGLRGNVQLALMASQRGKFDRIPPRLETAIASVDAMTALVQSLLDVSRLDRGTYHLDLVATDLQNTVASTIAAIRSQINFETHPIHFDDVDPVVVNLDRQAFRKVIENLLLTAVRYCPDGSDIDLRVRSSVNQALLELRYQGEPFSALDQRALRSPLYGERDGSSDSRSDSLPLDLAFCRGVISAHGGEILMSNRPETREHLITVRIPLQ